MKKFKSFMLTIVGMFAIIVCASMFTACSQDSYLTENPSKEIESFAIFKDSISEPVLRDPYVSNMIYTVPRYYEWDQTENPNHYNWCAHAALKSVLAYHGISVTMGTLHSYFCTNSPVGYGNGGRCDDNKFCANLYDMYLACHNVNQLNLPNSGYESIGSISTFFQRLKDGVDYNKPAIVPSTYDCSYGHMYIVVGYQEGPNYNQRYLYLRDVKVQYNVSGTLGIYDKVCSVQDFYNNFEGGQIFFVRPN